MNTRTERAARTIAALPEDPRTWTDAEVAEFQAGQKWHAEEIGKIDRRKERAEMLRQVKGLNESPARTKIPQRPKVEPWTWDKGREAALQRAGGLCEARTEACETLVTQVHHIAGRDWKGCHHPDLLLAVCGEGNLTGCHGWIHGHTEAAKAAGWMRNRDEARRFYGTKPMARANERDQPKVLHLADEMKDLCDVDHRPTADQT